MNAFLSSTSIFNLYLSFTNSTSCKILLIPHLFTSFITILFLHLSLSLLSFSHFRFSNLFFSFFPSFHSSLSLLLSSSLSDLSFFHSFIIFLIYSVILSYCSHILSSISFPISCIVFTILSSPPDTYFSIPLPSSALYFYYSPVFSLLAPSVFRRLHFSVRFLLSLSF